MVCYKTLFGILVMLRIISAQSDLETVDSVVGQSVELPCNVTTLEEGDTLDILAWYRNGSSSSFYSSRDFRTEDGGSTKSGRYQLVRANDTVMLRISSVTPADAGLYMCHVDFSASPSLKTYVQLEVIDPPQLLWMVHENGTKIAIASNGANESKNIGPYFVGDTVHLFCISFGGNPQPSLSWWIEKRLLKESSTPLSQERMRSDVMYGPLEREDHGLVLTCYAANNRRIKPLAIDVTINMYLPPALVRLRQPSNDLSTTAQVRAGAPLDLQCRVLGARPPPPIEWRIDDRQLSTIIQNITTESSQRLLVSEIQLRLGPENDESRVTCCAEMYARDDDTKYLCAQPLHIVVLYPPSVQIVVENELLNNTMAVVKGSDVIMNCSYQANPNVHRLMWYHQDDVFAKYTSSEVTPTLVVSNVTEELAGEYACEATNAEGTAYSEPVLIDVTYPAVCLEKGITEYGLGEDEFLNITCQVNGNPAPSAYRWVLANSSVNAVTLHTVAQETLETDEPTLLYQRPSGIPYSTVFCWGLNGVSSSGLSHTPCIYLITDETIPKPPYDCVATRNAYKDIVVTCAKGYDGGLPQKFNFAIISSSDNKKSIVSISNVEPKFLVPEPNEEYFKFIITAENDKGESGEVEIDKKDIIDEIPDLEGLPKSAVANITTLTLALCGGVLLVALIACGLVLCAHERSSRHDIPHDRSDPPLCAYNTEESNCDTFHGSDDGSECNVRRTESFRRAVSRYPSRNFDVRRTSSFHSARYMNDMAEHNEPKFDTFRHSPNCRVHSLQNISRKRDMDALCDHLVMQIPPEVNYNVARPMNTFYTMPRKMRQKLAKELSDETSEITQTSDGFSLPPPPDEYGSYRAGPRIRDMPTKPSPTYSTLRKSLAKEARAQPNQQYNNVILSPLNTVGLPTTSAAHNSVYSYPDDDSRAQKTTGLLNTFHSQSSAKESGI
ncbi:unnamed protein product [Chilo suppressalis]|uniref:Ig-like domain-containing protein n=1 Tax=Chilo suppressalis TaxID=168631 RepID=A0ABN8BHC7_CHISP|nr:hypothetical protein evm_011899 [Chilo suppressalis]CAH0406526.1 unnamed protein product [Chilo suppressalis]